MDESCLSDMPLKKNIFSDKTNLKNISDNLLDSNEEKTNKEVIWISIIINKNFD